MLPVFFDEFRENLSYVQKNKILMITEGPRQLVFSAAAHTLLASQALGLASNQVLMSLRLERQVLRYMRTVIPGKWAAISHAPK